MYITHTHIYIFIYNVKTMSSHQYLQCQFNTMGFILAWPPPPSICVTLSLTKKTGTQYITLNILTYCINKEHLWGGGGRCQQPGRKYQSPSWGGGQLCRHCEVSGSVTAAASSLHSVPDNLHQAASSLRRCSPHPAQAPMPYPSLPLPHLCADACPVRPRR